MQRDLNKEAFLWYAMTSPKYLDRSYAKLKEAAEFLRQHIKSHEEIQRYPPVIRWLGEMERLEESYANARAMMAHGEFSAINDWAGLLMKIPRGFSESIMTWMGDDSREFFEKTLNEAYGIATSYMDATVMSGLHFDDPHGDWRVDEDQGFQGSDIRLYWEDFAEHVHELPEYAADTSLSCTTGEIVPWTGVWIPANGAGTAALAFAMRGQIMQPAYEVFPHPDDPSYEATRPVDVIWHPFRPTGRMIRLDGDATVELLRIPAGRPASQSGYWHTAAKQGSRRHFKQGDIFPEIEGSSYGATFWQWSPDQSDPSLR